MLGDRSTPVSDVASISAFSELMDDRDSRIQYGAAFGDWSDSELFGGTEKYADISNGNYSDKDATATIPFNGPGIEIYGLKSSQLGLAEVTIDGKSVGELDFYTAGATEKGVLIGRYTNLSSGPHLMTITVKREHKGRGSERSKISLDYFKVFPGQGETVEKIDDRDSRIQYGSAFKDWTDAELYASTEKYADINADDSLAPEAIARIPFSGTGIRIYGLKTSALGKALVTLDGKEMPSLDFYTAGATEKGALIGEFTNLADGDHVLTLKVDPDSPDGRKKISLDSFDILKAPSVSLDTPSLEPIKVEDKTVTLTLPTGNWDAVAVTFPGVTDPLVLRKVDENHLVTSGEQTVLSIKDNKVEIGIPETTERKTGNPIEAYAILGETRSSTIVTVFPKGETAPVEDQVVTSKGDEPAPVVTIPEYTEPIGTAGEQEAPIVDIPEYTEPIGTAGEQEAPIVDIPEYTGPIGTASDQAAPIISLPEFKLKALKDQATGVQVISGANELGEASYLEIQKVDKQELLGKKYDAYDIQLKNENGQLIQAKGAVLVRLPISGTVQEFYRFSSEKDLKAQDFTIRDGMLEFLTIDLTTYAIVYKTETEVQQPSSSQIEEASPLANKNQLNGENSTNDKQLPATGEESSPLLFMASLSLALTSAFLLKGKKE